LSHRSCVCRVIGHADLLPGAATPLSRSASVRQQVQAGSATRCVLMLDRPHQGCSVAVSGDGKPAISGWPDLSLFCGAAWLHASETRRGPIRAAKLIGTGPTNIGCARCRGPHFRADAHSHRGSQVTTGSRHCVGLHAPANGVWTPRATSCSAPFHRQVLAMFLVGLSPTANTAVWAGVGDHSWFGSAWFFHNAHGVWTQQGDKLVGTVPCIPPKVPRSPLSSARRH